jgi:hypothetical protein
MGIAPREWKVAHSSFNAFLRLLKYPTVIPFLRPSDPFPPVSKALRSPNGLLCAGADLSPQRLVDAYSQGILPWFSEGDPILWWSPHPRMVLFPGELKVSRSLRRTLAKDTYETRFDTAFARVMEECGSGPLADPRYVAGSRRPRFRASYAAAQRPAQRKCTSDSAAVPHRTTAPGAPRGGGKAGREGTPRRLAGVSSADRSLTTKRG